MLNLANVVKLSHVAYHSSRPEVQNPNFMIFGSGAAHMKVDEMFSSGHHVPNPGQRDKTAVTSGLSAETSHVGHDKIRKQALHVFLASNLGFGLPGVTG